MFLFGSEYWSNLTIEPCAVLFWLAHHYVTFIYSNLFLQKNCRVNQTHEPDLNTPCENEKRGVAHVAFINSWFHFPTYILMNVLSALIINWSDIAGRKRKIILLLAVFGQILEMSVGSLHSYFWQWPSLAALLSYELCQIFTGGRILFLHAMILYMSDISSKEKRTSQLSRGFLLYYICIPFGNALSGFMLKSVGFFYSYLIGLFISIVAFSLGIVFIKDISIPVEKKESFLKMINPIRFKDAITTIFRKRPHYKRFILVLLLVSDFMVLFTRTGEIVLRI